MLINNRPIGIFDSGVGGLTVAKTLMHTLPGENFIYFGDTAHVPYGNKSEAELFKYARDIISFLINRDVKAIVVACGTHSSVTLSQMEKECPVPILGVVKPGSRTAASTSRNRRIGVIATQATVNSHAYSENIHSIDSECKVFEVACPRFVPLVESGILSGDEVEHAVAEYILPLVETGIDTLVLGCTHYPFLTGPISDFAGSNVALIDPAMETIEELHSILKNNKIANTNDKCGEKEFYVSGNDESFYKVGKLLLGDIIAKVDRVSLD